MSEHDKERDKTHSKEQNKTAPEGVIQPGSKSSGKSGGNPQAIVCLRNVFVRRGKRTLLKNISWEVSTGDFWIVLGANGAGKSTLLKAVVAELFPTDGTVEVLGCLLGRVDVRALRKRIGITGAFLNNSFRANINVRDVVMSGLHAARETWWHSYSSADADSALELLGSVGCDHLSKSRFGDCSTGERQRILLARTLMSEPELLVLDEPTAGLDLQGREDLLYLLAGGLSDISQKPLTTLFVTHHVEEIPASATHILLLKNGEIAASGEIENVLTSENLQNCFDAELQLERRSGRWWSWRDSQPESATTNPKSATANPDN